MTKYIFLLLLVPCVLFAQNTMTTGGVVGNTHVLSQEQVYQKTTYTVSTLDTTTWFNIEPYTSVALLLQTTDSANFDIYCDARNAWLPNTNQYTTFADSILLADSVAGGANSGERKHTLLKTTTLNRLNQPANNQVRFRVDHRAAGAGTTSGRVVRIWLIRSVY